MGWKLKSSGSVQEQLPATIQGIIIDNLKRMQDNISGLGVFTSGIKLEGSILNLNELTSPNIFCFSQWDVNKLKVKREVQKGKVITESEQIGQETCNDFKISHVNQQPYFDEINDNQAKVIASKQIETLSSSKALLRHASDIKNTEFGSTFPNNGIKRCGNEDGTGRNYQQYQVANQTSKTVSSVNVLVSSTGQNFNHEGLGNGGDDGDDDDEKRRRKIMPGHYEEKAVVDLENEVQRNSVDNQNTSRDRCPETVVRKSLDNKLVSPNHQKRVDQQFLGGRRIKFGIMFGEDKIQHIDKLHQDILHSAYCAESQCYQGMKCILIKQLILHLTNHAANPTCYGCQLIDAALFQHATYCKIENSCVVHNCACNRNWIQEAMKRKENRKARVIYSQTKAFTKDSFVYEGVDYCILYKKQIGKGGNGYVYREWFFDLVHSYQGDIACKEVDYGLREEAKVIDSLGEGHPNIIKTMAIIDMCNMKKGFVFMELCDCSLYNYFCKFVEQNCTSGLPLDLAIYYLIQVVSAVSFMHSKGIVHKDIKPMNTLLTENFQRVKLADFDSAMPLEDEVSKLGRRVGTLGYAAPEVMNSQPHGTPADIYSLGCFLLELLYGWQWKIPQEGRNKQVEDLTSNEPELGLLVKQCLQDIPEKRPTAQEIEKCLQKYLEPDYRPKFQPMDPHKKYQGHQRAVLEDLSDNEVAIRKSFELSNEEEKSIEKIMDGLPKELTSIKEPTSHTWVERMQDCEGATAVVTQR